MIGWGHVAVLMGVGLSVAIGCGGRTDALEGESDETVAGYGGNTSGGKTNQGGKSNKGGKSNTGGSKNLGGTVGEAGEGPYGGTGPIPVAGYGGTFPTGGTFTVGGYGGYGGYGAYSGFGGDGGVFTGGYGGTGFAGTSFGGAPSTCQSCLQQACTSEVLQCVGDGGCISIFACLEETGCRGLKCYSDAACKQVIDENGGPAGASMNRLLGTFACGFNAACPCN